MKKLDYLKLALKAKCYGYRSWVISAFAVTQDSVNNVSHDPYPYRLYRNPIGVEFLDPTTNKRIKIDDSVPNEPLFKFLDPIIVTNDMCENVTNDIDTYIGNLLFNLICITSSFGKKYPFVTGVVSIKKIEDVIAERLQDTPDKNQIREDRYIYVDEYVKFVDSLTYLQEFSSLCTIAATKKNISTAPGFNEYRDNLINTKYKGKLNNPVELANLESDCKKYDEEFLKDDPSNGKFMSGRVKDVARKKLHLLMGSSIGFEETVEVTPILTSLEEGWQTDPKSFTAMMNGLRFASFSRGSETVRGGVSAKTILRACSTAKIIDTDCNSTMGIQRLYIKSDYHKLVGRYIINNNVTILIENIEQAKDYIDKKVIVRSPCYCKLSEYQYCAICVGKNLAINPKGIAIALNDVSAVILATSMKAIHGKSLKTNKIDLNRCFS